MSVKQRHDSLRQVVAELARSLAPTVTMWEVEPRFPCATDEIRLDTALLEEHVHSVTKVLPHADLLLVRGNTRELLDV